MSAYRVSANIVFRSTSPTLVMAFDRVKGVMYEFNETAASVLQLINGQRSVDDLLALLADEYEIEPSDEGAIRHDIEEIVQRFLGVGIIEHVNTHEQKLTPSEGSEGENS